MRVTLESGPICGLVDELPNLPKYARFLNVPYAEQPVGALRFKVRPVVSTPTTVPTGQSL